MQITSLTGCIRLHRTSVYSIESLSATSHKVYSVPAGLRYLVLHSASSSHVHEFTVISKICV